MDQLRESIRQKEQEKIEALLPKFEKAIGLPLDNFLNQEFIAEIPKESFVWHIIQNTYFQLFGKKYDTYDLLDNQLYQDITINDFVQESITAISNLHTRIVDYRLNLSIVTDSIRQLKEQIAVAESFKELQFNQTNKLAISYTKHKNLKTAIFNHYQIKFKVAMNGQEQKSIYPTGDDNNICAFPLLEDSNCLYFQVLGKPLQGESKEFIKLSEIELELGEIFISLNLKSLSKEVITPCILTLDYYDETREAPFSGTNYIELKFQFYMHSQLRLTMMQRQLEKQQIVEGKLNELMNNTERQIQQILLPYKDARYVNGRDIVFEREKDPQSERGSDKICEVCRIF